MSIIEQVKNSRIEIFLYGGTILLILLLLISLSFIIERIYKMRRDEKCDDHGADSGDWRTFFRS